MRSHLLQSFRPLQEIVGMISHIKVREILDVRLPPTAYADARIVDLWGRIANEEFIIDVSSFTPTHFAINNKQEKKTKKGRRSNFEVSIIIMISYRIRRFMRCLSIARVT